MPALPRGQRHPAELKERAVRMVLDHQHEYSSQWKAIVSIAGKLDVNHETLRQWVRQAEKDSGQRPGCAPTSGSGSESSSAR
jgi:transposase